MLIKLQLVNNYQQGVSKVIANFDTTVINACFNEI
jgi:hypothetical protein